MLNFLFKNADQRHPERSHGSGAAKDLMADRVRVKASLLRQIAHLPLLAVLALCAPAYAQSALGQILSPSTAASSTKPTDRLGRNTPKGTFYGFLQAAQAGDYSLAAQYLQLSAARRQTEGDDLAMRLNYVMNRAFTSPPQPSAQPEGAPQEDVPLDRQKLGAISAGDVEVEFELVRVSDPSAGKIWLVSSDTLAKIPELYDQVEARQVETKLPAWIVKHQIAGMPLWQWFALLLLIPIATAAGWILLFILQLPLRWWSASHAQPPAVNWTSVSGPAWLLAATLIHRVLADYLGMPLLQRHYYIQVTEAAVVIGANWILWRLIRWFLRRVRNRALGHGHGGTASLILLGERIIKAIVFVMAAFSILGILGFNLSTALAGLGIGGIAIGFGAQQTIANLFGGVSVLGDEVIRVGDVCKFGDRTGTVEDIGLRSTRVRTEERTLLAIPNGTVATINVENLSRRDKLLFKTALGFHLDTSSDNLGVALSEIRRVLTSNPNVEASTVRVSLIELGSSAINVELVCYILTRDFNRFAEVREELLLKIMRFVEDSGASLAKPSQTLYLSQDDRTAKDEIKAAAGKAKQSNDGSSKISGKPA
jgi:MscS family membrane protein